MNIESKTRAKVIGKIKEPQKKDPSKFSHNLLIMQKADAGKLYVSEDIFNSVKEGDEYEITLSFNQQYSSLSIKELIPVTNQK